MSFDICRMSLPGPGTYKAEEAVDIISCHPVPPAFSLAPPWQPPRPTSARPGPGAYRQALWNQHFALQRCQCARLCLRLSLHVGTYCPSLLADQRCLTTLADGGDCCLYLMMTAESNRMQETCDIAAANKP